MAGLAVLLSGGTLSAAPESLTGSIVGVVSNALGIPQMGAAVALYNRLDRQIARATTDEKGTFQFDSLPSDMYSLKVTLASFVPAFRHQIGVQPGIRRVMAINLASVFSTIELVYSLPVQQGLMSDDWMWTLRGARATRPILRVLADARDPLRMIRSESSVFSHTRGVLRLSAGDTTAAPTLGSQPDLGTAFALATSFMGANQLEFTGNVGYALASGNPAAGFRTSYSRRIGEASTPELAVTMRQIFLAGRTGMGIVSGRSESLPALRTLSVGLSDRIQVSDSFNLTYGATMESVSFLDRLNYISPFAKASYKIEDIGIVEFGYSSGLPPTHLYEAGAEADQEIAQLGMFPRVSLRDGRAQVQRAQNVELGFRKTVGSRSFSAGAYRESMTNAALTALDAAGALPSRDLLPDLFSRASIFNAGRFRTSGYMASFQQNLSQRWSVTVAYGNSGVLEAAQDNIPSGDPVELRRIVRTQRRHWATTRLTGAVPVTATRFSTSYQFMNGRALTPGHFYITQMINPQQGWNVNIRQPLPGLGGVPGKLEATADVRNMLAQGYQPIQMGAGRRIQLAHSPRALRGGLAFIF